jgi:hypothetical protein
LPDIWIASHNVLVLRFPVLCFPCGNLFLQCIFINVWRKFLKRLIRLIGVEVITSIESVNQSVSDSAYGNAASGADSPDTYPASSSPP